METITISDDIHQENKYSINLYLFAFLIVEVSIDDKEKFFI